MPIISVPFTNSKQQKTFWCWAAVAANVYNSMRPASVPAVSQCDVVTMVESNCNGNDPDSLPSALFDLGINDQLLARPRAEIIVNEFKGVSDALNPDKNQNGIAEPVCAEILFPGNAYHYAAISQVDTDSQNVWVADPYLGGDPIEFSYENFTQNYNFTHPNSSTPVPGAGTVTHFQRVVNKWQASS
jgi:hypothetical protein